MKWSKDDIIDERHSVNSNPECMRTEGEGYLRGRSLNFSQRLLRVLAMPTWELSSCSRHAFSYGHSTGILLSYYEVLLY